MLNNLKWKLLQNDIFVEDLVDSFCAIRYVWNIYFFDRFYVL